MNWESLAGPGVALGLASLAGYGAYVRLATRFEGQKSESDRRFKEGEDDRKDLRLRLETIDREAVRRTDMAAMKTEIIERVKDVEHTFRNEQAKSVAALGDMFRALLDRALEKRA